MYDQLFLAALQGNLREVKKLWKALNHINDLHPVYKVSLMCFALQSGSIPLVEFLSTQGATLRIG